MQSQIPSRHRSVKTDFVLLRYRRGVKGYCRLPCFSVIGDFNGVLRGIAALPVNADDSECLRLRELCLHIVIALLSVVFRRPPERIIIPDPIIHVFGQKLVVLRAVRRNVHARKKHQIFAGDIDADTVLCGLRVKDRHILGLRCYTASVLCRLRKCLMPHEKDKPDARNDIHDENSKEPENLSRIFLSPAAFHCRILFLSAADA